jgi:hypothetical protein
MSLKTWWKNLWREEYELIITVPGDVIIHADGGRTEKKSQQIYHAKKLVKTTPKHFVFIDMDGKRNEIKFLQPVVFHVVKIW